MDYKHQYESMKKMVTMYQDEIVPGLWEKIKELEKQVPKWIPVSERLPEDDLPKDSKRKSIKVLVAYKTSKGVPVVRTQVREKDPWYNSKGWDWTKSEPITHWMPLPTPPEGGCNEA